MGSSHVAALWWRPAPALCAYVCVVTKVSKTIEHRRGRAVGEAGNTFIKTLCFIYRDELDHKVSCKGWQRGRAERIKKDMYRWSAKDTEG